MLDMVATVKALSDIGLIGFLLFAVIYLARFVNTQLSIERQNNSAIESLAKGLSELSKSTSLQAESTKLFTSFIREELSAHKNHDEDFAESVNTKLDDITKKLSSVELKIDNGIMCQRSK